MDFRPYEPDIKYAQHDNNSCVFSILEYSLFGAREHVAEQAIVM